MAYRNKADQVAYHKERWLRIKKDKPHLKRTYGITVDEYNDMFTFQDGKCAGCNTHQSELKSALSVDHDHAIGAVRGLLCRKCNSAIGLIADNIVTLNSMIKYLNND